MIVSVTGSRKVGRKDRLTISNAMRFFVQDTNVTGIYFGGAIGVDSEALGIAWCIASQTLRACRFVVVVPGLIHEQPPRATRMSALADEVIELGLPPSDRNRFRTRNQYLVDKADVLLAFWNGDERSGTAMTMRMAERKGIPINVVRIGGAK